MSRGVDVLAVIDRAIETAILVPDLASSLKQARAAVAELVEECDTLTMTAHAHADSALRSRIAAIRNSLARVRGEA